MNVYLNWLFLLFLKTTKCNADTVISRKQPRKVGDHRLKGNEMSNVFTASWAPTYFSWQLCTNMGILWQILKFFIHILSDIGNLDLMQGGSENVWSSNTATATSKLQMWRNEEGNIYRTYLQH